MHQSGKYERTILIMSILASEARLDLRDTEQRSLVEQMIFVLVSTSTPKKKKNAEHSHIMSEK